MQGSEWRIAGGVRHSLFRLRLETQLIHKMPTEMAAQNQSIGRVRGSKIQTYTAGVICDAKPWPIPSRPKS